MHQLRAAVRQLARRPRSSILAITTIALALGASLGIATIVDHTMLRPLPYPEPDRLVVVWNTYPQWREREILSRFWDRIDLAYPEYEALRARTDVFDEVAIIRADDQVLMEHDRADIILGGTATPGLLRALGIAPAMGRWFTPEEDRQGAAPVAVVRHEFWKSRLGADPGVLGSTIVLDGEAHTIVGVLPDGFRFGRVDEARPPEVWTALGRTADAANPGNHSYLSIARLRDGVTREQALAVTTATLRGDRSPELRGARLIGRDEYERGATRPMMLLFAGGVLLLLILAAATVATIQLTRVAERSSEMAVRSALGASRGSIARQLLAENVVLGLIGGTVGIALAWATVGSLVRLMPAGTMGLEAVRIDARVLLFAIALSTAMATLFGFAPILEATRRDPARMLRGERATRGPRALSLMLGVQSALAVLLLSGAALLVRTVRVLDAVDPGFAREQRLTFTVSLEGEDYTPERREPLFAELTERIAALPGVLGVEATSVLPLSGESNSNAIWLASSGAERAPKPEAERRIVSAGFFEGMGIRLLRGRAFEPTDDPERPLVMVVSRSAAEQLWGVRDPLGDRVKLNSRWWTVVGVVEDVRDRALAAPPEATVYVPAAQWRPRSRGFVVRTAVPPLQIAGQVREIVRAMDPAVPVRDLRTMEQLAHESTRAERARAVLLGGYAVLATLLALAGLYGVTSYAARLRTKEFAIRSALGAQTWRVVRLAMGRTVSAAFVGALVGLLVAIAGAGVLRGFLYGVEPADPVSLGFAALGLCGFALVVAAGPAVRSARRDPVEALRRE